LHSAAARIKALDDSYGPDDFESLLTRAERKCLRLHTPSDASSAARLIGYREELLTETGVALGVAGLAGFVVLVMEFSD
jgi:hypothetical protein